MNSVFSAFKSNKNNPLSPTEKRAQHASKKTPLNLESNNYEKLRHIREKMSNLIIDDDEINLKKRPPIPPIASYDECDRALPIAAAAAPSNLSSSSSSSSLNTITLAPIQKHYNNDNSENYASENNLLSKCCNGSVVACSSKVIVDSASSAIDLNSMKSVDDVCGTSSSSSKSTSNIFSKQPQAATNLSNTNRNRLRLSLSNGNNGIATASSSTTTASNQPAVHGRNNANGLPTGRTRLSTHQRNLSLDFR